MSASLCDFGTGISGSALFLQASTPTLTPTPTSTPNLTEKKIDFDIHIFFQNKSQIKKNLIIASLIFGGFILGLILEIVLRSELNRSFKNAKWEGFRIITTPFKGLITFVFTMAGFYMSILYVNIGESELKIIHKVIVIVVIIFMTIIFSRVVVALEKQYLEKVAKVLPHTTLIGNITRLFIYLMGFLVLMDTLGVSITPILTAMGVGGLAVALALQKTLSNLFSGLYIIASKEVEPGQYVKLSSGEEGYVMDITWRSTMIKDLTDYMIIIPNSKLAETIISNYSRPEKEMSILVPVGVGYESNLTYVEKVTKEVVRKLMNEVDGGVKDFIPEIRFHTFADSSINMTVVLRIKEYADHYSIRNEFVKRLHARYNKEGINLPFPIRTVEMKGDSKGDLKVELNGDSKKMITND